MWREHPTPHPVSLDVLFHRQRNAFPLFMLMAMKFRAVMVGTVARWHAPYTASGTGLSVGTGTWSGSPPSYGGAANAGAYTDCAGYVDSSPSQLPLHLHRRHLAQYGLHKAQEKRQGTRAPKGRTVRVRRKRGALTGTRAAALHRGLQWGRLSC